MRGWRWGWRLAKSAKRGCDTGLTRTLLHSYEAYLRRAAAEVIREAIVMPHDVAAGPRRSHWTIWTCPKGVVVHVD